MVRSWYTRGRATIPAKAAKDHFVALALAGRAASKAALEPVVGEGDGGMAPAEAAAMVMTGAMPLSHFHGLSGGATTVTIRPWAPATRIAGFERLRVDLDEVASNAFEAALNVAARDGDAAFATVKAALSGALWSQAIARREPDLVAAALARIAAAA